MRTKIYIIAIMLLATIFGVHASDFDKYNRITEIEFYNPDGKAQPEAYVKFNLQSRIGTYNLNRLHIQILSFHDLIYRNEYEIIGEWAFVADPTDPTAPEYIQKHQIPIPFRELAPNLNEPYIIKAWLEDVSCRDPQEPCGHWKSDEFEASYYARYNNGRYEIFPVSDINYTNYLKACAKQRELYLTQGIQPQRPHFDPQTKIDETVAFFAEGAKQSQQSQQADANPAPKKEGVSSINASEIVGVGLVALFLSSLFGGSSSDKNDSYSYENSKTYLEWVAHGGIGKYKP